MRDGIAITNTMLWDDFFVVCGVSQNFQHFIMLNISPIPPDWLLFDVQITARCEILGLLECLFFSTNLIELRCL